MARSYQRSIVMYHLQGACGPLRSLTSDEPCKARAVPRESYRKLEIYPTVARCAGEVRPFLPGTLPYQRRAGRGISALGLRPDAPVVHELELPLGDVVAVRGVLHRGALRVEVLRVDGLLVERLVELGPDVLEPVVPLGARAMVAQRLDVDDACDVRRARAVLLLADDAPLVVDDVRAAAEGVDGRRLLGEEVVGAHVRGHDVQVVVECARPALDLEHLVPRRGVRVGGAVDDLRAVQRERPRVLGVGALVRHHDAEPADLRVHHGPEGVQGAAVLRDPPVVDVVGADRVLDGEEGRDFVVLEDDPAARVDDEPDVEEPVFQVGVPGLRLRHDERVVLLRDLAERLGLVARDVDRALAREGGVVEVEHLVVERLQRALGEGDEAHGQVEARQPGGGLHEVREMVEVDLDVLALADSADGGDQTDGGRGRDRGRASSVEGYPAASRSPADSTRRKSIVFTVASVAPVRIAAAAIMQSPREPRRRPPRLHSRADSGPSSPRNGNGSPTILMASSTSPAWAGPQRNSAQLTALIPTGSPVASHARRRRSSGDPRDTPRIRKSVSRWIIQAAVKRGPRQEGETRASAGGRLGLLAMRRTGRSRLDSLEAAFNHSPGVRGRRSLAPPAGRRGSGPSARGAETPRRRGPRGTRPARRGRARSHTPS